MSIGLIVDIAVLAVILVSVVIAVLRGFIREVLTIFGLAGGVAAAWIGGPLLVETTRGWVGYQENAEEPQLLLGALPYSVLADILAYGLVFVTFVVILSVISHFLSKAVRNMGLGAIDRALGAVFGLARAALVLGLLYLLPFYMIEDEQKEEIFVDSKSQVYLEATARWIDGFIPKLAEDEQEGEESEGVVSEARKKFEELGILEEGQEEGGEALPKSGYTEEFRDGVDRLIEEKVQDVVEDNIEPLMPPAADDGALNE